MTLNMSSDDVMGMQMIYLHKLSQSILRKVRRILILTVYGRGGGLRH